MAIDTHPGFETFFQNCHVLAQTIENNQEQLITLLAAYETQDAARDEIMRSISALNGLREEFSAITTPLEGLNISTIFPLNLPLYSLIIFGVAPSAFAHNVFIRPPEVMQEVLASLWEILGIDSLFPAIALKVTPRHVFIHLYAAESDVIIFTGKYQNALAIHKECPHSLLIYNGSGVNPFLLFDNADVSLAAEKAVEMRCFNSGQDCAGPDEFTEKLTHELSHIKVGDTRDASVDVGKTMKQTYITELKQWLEREGTHIVYGGEIDEEKYLVYPTIVRKKINDHVQEEFHEFFAPYFYILEYENIAELEHILASTSFNQRAMYVSVFGDNPAVEAQLTKVRILKNKIVNDVESGNTQYGGYGDEANFLLYGDQKVARPILISRDMHTMFQA
jgi:aldehyde dehydrogenase (NAD+)